MLVIHHSEPQGQFALIPNATLRDPRLSYAARGILAELLTRPDGWDETMENIYDRRRRERGAGAEGRRAIAAAWSELESAGYLRRVKTRGTRGRFITDLHIYDVAPMPTDMPPAGQSVTPAQTSNYAGRTDTPPAGKPVTTASQHVSAGRTDIPPTDQSVDRQSVDRPPGRRSPIQKTGNEDSLSRQRARFTEQTDGTEREIDHLFDKLRRDPQIRHVRPYLDAAIVNGDAQALIAETRRGLKPPSQSSPTEQPWCGECGREDRRIELANGRVADCPTCYSRVPVAAAH